MRRLCRPILHGGTLLTALLVLTSYGAAQTFTTLHSFPAYPGDGLQPLGNLAVGSGGVLYGVTQNNAVNDPSSSGTVFSLTPPATPGGAWTEAVLYTFSGPDGKFPHGGVTLSSDGTLYGTTSQGGASNLGVVFALTPPASPGGPWIETVLHSFAGGSDGGDPQSSVTIGPAGVLYGTTYEGGTASCDCGVVFALVPPDSAGDSWTEHVLLRFQGDNGSSPTASLVMDRAGVLYGASSSTVFSLIPPASAGIPWTANILYTGSQQESDGIAGTPRGLWG
jgi:uncharacterized repeat protein (TIGR03803 family)